MNNYFNTTHIRGQELRRYEINAKHQDTKILEFFHRNRHVYATAEDLQKLLMPMAPITSVRRALSNLQSELFIKKGPQVEGQYGNAIYSWTLDISEPQGEAWR
jgi:hypothetical protein